MQVVGCFFYIGIQNRLVMHFMHLVAHTQKGSEALYRDFFLKSETVVVVALHRLLWTGVAVSKKGFSVDWNWGHRGRHCVSNVCSKPNVCKKR